MYSPFGKEVAEFAIWEFASIVALLCKVPTIYEGREEFLLARAEEQAMNLRTWDGAFALLFLIKCIDLKRAWSSTRTSAYWCPPCMVRVNGPAICRAVDAWRWLRSKRRIPRNDRAGESAVSEGRARRRFAPAWSRRCIWRVASLGNMMLTWCEHLDACVARNDRLDQERHVRLDAQSHAIRKCLPFGQRVGCVASHHLRCARCRLQAYLRTRSWWVTIARVGSLRAVSLKRRLRNVRCAASIPRPHPERLVHAAADPLWRNKAACVRLRLSRDRCMGGR
eukprot:3704175-Pleurochrysis_carterae.AAC.1